MTVRTPGPDRPGRLGSASDLSVPVVVDEGQAGAADGGTEPEVGPSSTTLFGSSLASRPARRGGRYAGMSD